MRGRRRLAATAGVLAAATIALASCTVQKGSVDASSAVETSDAATTVTASQTTVPAAEETEDPIPSCADWPTLDDEARSDAIPHLRWDKYPVRWSSTLVYTGATLSDYARPLLFLADGAVLDTASEIVDWACESTDDSSSSIDAAVAAAIRHAPKVGDVTAEAGCSDVASLQTDEERDLWARALNHFDPPIELDSTTLTQLCEALPDARFTTEDGWPDSYRIPARWAFVPSFTTTTTTQLGYVTVTETSLSEVLDPNTTLDEIVSQRVLPDYDYDVGDGCGELDPATDRFMVAYVSMRSATEEFDTSEMRSSWTILPTGTVETTTAEIEFLYDDDPECVATLAPRGTRDTFGVLVTPDEDNTSGVLSSSHRTAFVIILRDYISPRYPDGASTDLDGIVLQGSGGGSTEDPVVELEAGSMTLSGVVQ